MKRISFWKMSGSGNDFVVIDNRKGSIHPAKSWVKEICGIHTGIGADGILLLENSRKASFKMRIFNPDGSQAEACGNGFRCIARFARQRLRLPDSFRFESQSGLIEACVSGGHVRVQLVKPSGYHKGELRVSGRRFRYSFINTGVPHTVLFVEGLEKIEVNGLGRTIRHHDQFMPRGTNVNFAEIKGRHEIHLRTYERGVEAETLACGTGSTASALVSALAGYVEAPVRVKTSGGEILTVNFERRGGTFSNVTLEGKAEFVFEGKWANGG